METQFVKDKMRGQLSLKHLLVWLFCILFQLFFFLILGVMMLCLLLQFLWYLGQVFSIL